MSAPLFDRIMQHALAKSFGLSLEPSLIPESEIKLEDADTRLKPMEVVFLNSALPHDFRSQWRNLFNSRYDKVCYTKFRSKHFLSLWLWTFSCPLVRYFGMISQNFGMKIYYDFSQFLDCSCEIHFEANEALEKVEWFH